MALKQALFQAEKDGSDLTQIVHHSDRGSQYIAGDYTRELIEVGVQLSVGSTGDSYDNAFVEPVYDANKTVEVHDSIFFVSVGDGGLGCSLNRMEESENNCNRYLFALQQR